MSLVSLAESLARNELTTPFQLRTLNHNNYDGWIHSPEAFAKVVRNAPVYDYSHTSSAQDLAQTIRMITSIGDRYLLLPIEAREGFREAFSGDAPFIIEKYSKCYTEWQKKLLSRDKEQGFIPALTDFGLETIQSMLSGNRFRVCLDVTDTLGVIAANKKEPFPNVAEALADLLSIGRVDLISGDALKNIDEGFLHPSGLHPDPSVSRFPLELLENLFLWGRYGLDSSEYVRGNAIFTDTKTCLQGIPRWASDSLIKQWIELCDVHDVPNRFIDRLETQHDKQPGCYETHGDFQHGNVSLMFFIVGKLNVDSREKFKTAPECQADRDLMFQMAKELKDYCDREINPKLPVNCPQIEVAQEGVSTIAAGTAHKGILMEQLRNEDSEAVKFIFGGDRIFDGNDLPAAVKSDYAIQVGRLAEIDATMFFSFGKPVYHAEPKGIETIATYLKHIARVNAAHEVLFGIDKPF